MPEVEQVQITHCCNMNCLCNNDGVHGCCPSCGTSDVNYQFVFRCPTCGRDFDHDDRAWEHLDEHIFADLEELASGIVEAGDTQRFSEIFGTSDLSFDIGTLDSEALRAIFEKHCE